jgi:Ca-activated chloride channel homolog
MLNIKTTFDKSGFFKGQKEALLLLELIGQLGSIQSVSRKKKGKKQRKNVCLAVDVSGSMDENIFKHQYIPDIQRPVVIPSPYPQPHDPYTPWPKPHNPFPSPEIWMHTCKLGGVGVAQSTTVKSCLPQSNWIERLTEESQKRNQCCKKIEQAKKATLQAVDSLDDGDILSIVVFNSTVRVVLEATVLDQHNRNAIKAKISGLKASGGTNLHEGWVHASAQVARNLSEGTLSTVLLLSDGQTNEGLRSNDAIASNVSKIQKTGIITSTFGIGEDFNEDLLQAMANSGSGNFYYVDDEGKLEKMFADEFNGLSNVSASDIQLSFDLKDGFSIEKQLNGFEVKDGTYVLPNISKHNQKALLFNVSLNVDKAPKDYKNNGLEPQLVIGTFTVKYKDEDGKTRIEKIELVNQILSEKRWNNESYNSEVKVQETLLVIADNKTAATRLLDAGDFAGAQGLLRSSANFIQTSGYNDARLSDEVSCLNTTLSASASMNDKVFRKFISNQAYNTRNNKSDD